MSIEGIDHVQLAGPPGCEEEAQKAHPALRVRPDGLEPLAVRLQAAGAKVLWDEALGGVRRFYSEDPWGNRIELLAAPET